MKIDKHMNVVAGGRVYNAPGITRIAVNGTDFEMDYDWGRYTLKCNTSDVELFTDKPSITDVLLPDETGYMPPTERVVYKQRVIDKDATPHSYKQCACSFDGGKGFFDLAVKRIEEDNEIRETINEAVREVMTKDTVKRILAKKAKLKIDPDAFAKLIKKYNQDITRSGG